MRYHLDTIPLWEAFREPGECPLCAMQEKLEAEQVAMTLEGSAMEPARRIESNAAGYCARHLRGLALSQRNLTLSLVLGTHIGQLRRDLQPLFAAAEGGEKKAPAALAGALRGKTGSCVICRRVETVMGRYVQTLLHLWKSDPEFRKLLEGSKGFCLPHGGMLLEAGEKRLFGQPRRDFAACIAGLESRSLERLEQELQHYARMFDYRSKGQSWGTSRDVLPRATEKLRGGCPQSPIAVLEPELPPEDAPDDPA